MKKIAIIGGGASGLVAAIAAARTNPQAQILIYEKKDSAGKKILATGNGRCNLTNKDMNASYFHISWAPDKGKRKLRLSLFRPGFHRS